MALLRSKYAKTYPFKKDKTDIFLFAADTLLPFGIDTCQLLFWIACGQDRIRLVWSWTHAIARRQDRIRLVWSWTHATARHQDRIRHVLVLTTCHRPPSGPDSPCFGPGHMTSPAART